MKRAILYSILILLLAASPGWAKGPSFTGGGSGSGVQTDSDCDQAAYYAIGTLCQDTGDGKLYKGTGAAVVEIAAGSSGDFLADGSVAMTGALDAAKGLKVKDGTSPGYIQIYEASGNGTDYSSITGAANAGAYPSFTFAGSQGAPIFYLDASLGLWTMHAGASGATFAFTPIVTFNDNLRIYDGSHYLTFDADGLTGDATIVFGANTNNLAIKNGTAVFDVASGATLNVDKSLQIATGAVVINGNAGGSSVLGLPNQTLNFTTMTNGKLCGYNSTGTAIECDKDATGGTPTVITVADTADATSFVALFTDATGDLAPKTDAALTYAADTGILTATKFAGALNGTVGATTPAAGAFTTITASTSIAVAAAAATGGYVRLLEGTNNGTDYSSITGAANAGSYPAFTFGGSQGSEDLTLTATNDKWTFASTSGATITITPALTVTGPLTLSSQLNLMTTDADPATTTGGIKHDSSSTESQTTARGVLKWFDGTSVRTIADIGTDSTIITKTEFLPIRYAEDGSAAPAAAAAVTGKVVIARSFADGKDVVFFWSVPADYVGGGDVKYRVHYALATDASADDTVTFSMTGCAIANSANIACTAGTALTLSDELGTDDDQYQYMVTDYSAASNTDWGIAAGGFAKLGFSYSDGDYDAAALVIGIEIKYKAKLVGLAGY